MFQIRRQRDPAPFSPCHRTLYTSSPIDDCCSMFSPSHFWAPFVASSSSLPCWQQAFRFMILGVAKHVMYCMLGICSRYNRWPLFRPLRTIRRECESKDGEGSNLFGIYCWQAGSLLLLLSLLFSPAARLPALYRQSLILSLAEKPFLCTYTQTR